MSFRLFYVLLIFAAVKCGERIWAQGEGLASYYHHRFHGKKSSSGRVRDKEGLVAAHRTYPFGAFLRVANLKNMKSTIVCVMDHRPRHRKRIIDVSTNAAKMLDFIDKGVAKIWMKVVPGSLDLHYLSLTYPKVSYLDIDYLRPDPPYRVKFTE